MLEPEGVGGKQQGLGPRNDVLTTCKAIRYVAVLERAGKFSAVISPVSAARVQC